MANEIATTASISQQTGAPAWLVRRVIDRLVPDALRMVGRTRVLNAEQAAKIRDALQAIGYAGSKERELAHA